CTKPRIMASTSIVNSVLSPPSENPIAASPLHPRRNLHQFCSTFNSPRNTAIAILRVRCRQTGGFSYLRSRNADGRPSGEEGLLCVQLCRAGCLRPRLLLLLFPAPALKARRWKNP